ncbi:MAG: transposase [Candidatus Curtissbacteria bacterium]|nr:transposase [Candidatus Curtissbacteria bacterium]
MEKRDIFLDEQDYKVFLHFLKRYLTEAPRSPDRISPGWKTDLFDKLNLISYCLMPNHFHLLIKQSTKEAITDFMRALSNSYVRYFNEKYERVGALFQGKFKAVLIESDIYLLHLSRYIHLNPLEVRPADRSDLSRFLDDFSYSSYGEYIGQRKTEWIHPEEILSFFKTSKHGNLKDFLSYQNFVEDYKEDSKEILATLSLD